MLTATSLLAGCARAAAGAVVSLTGLAQVSLPPLTPQATRPAHVLNGPRAFAVSTFVRHYLQADSVHDYERMSAMTTGAISTYWSWYDQELGSCTCRVEPLAIDHVCQSVRKS